MAVNLSPIWGAGAQLLDNSGNVLTGGKIYTYLAGTTTPATTYTSSNGNTANSNPIILNSAGRVPYEIWLTDSIEYKFVLKDSNDTLIGTWDNLVGINSNFINYYGQQEIQTATADQTVFTLTEFEYQPGTGNLSVFVDGVNQYGPGAQYAYVETDSSTVTFVSGLHVGASVKFTTTKLENPGVADASQVSYTYPDANAVPESVESRLAQYVSVKDFGAVGDGVTDDTTAIQNAIDAVNNLYFPAGTYNCGQITIPQRDTYLYSEGATIKGTSGTYVFQQQKRGYLFSCIGLVFTGNAIGFYYNSDEGSLPNSTQYFEYQIQNCKFLQSGSVYAIKLYGAREGIISNCYFEGNSGIYTEFSINAKITDCQFKNCNYSILSKLGSEGLIASGLVMLGCSFGIRAERTTGVQIVNSMIDYCDEPVYLLGATDVLISNNYISTRTTNPAIFSQEYTDGFNGYNHIIIGNDVIDNYSTTGSACIRYENTDFVNITSNVLANYASNGFVYTNCTQMDFAQNIVTPRSGGGTNSVLSLTDSSTVRIYNNRVTQPINRTYVSPSTYTNAGFITEASGQATINNGTNSVIVTHGLAFTPSNTNIMLTPATTNLGSVGYAVTATSSTTFTITTSTNVTGNALFVWTAKTAP